MTIKRINPIIIVHDHIIELYEKYKATTDPQQKDVLSRRLSNLKDVLQFLGSIQNQNQLDYT